jgi:hypothetical protein
MSWNCGLYLSESFAEISAAQSGGKLISKFWYLRSKSLVDGLKEFFEQNSIGAGSRLRVSTFWPEMIVQKSMGAPPVLLVSEGFEDWLHLRQPKRSHPPQLPPERTRSFLSSDYIFGISERTDAEGKIQRKPTIEDLEFLHQKFLLSNNKNVGIGFLHSSKNPENENLVASFFRERDYKVWASHQYGGGLNEVSRWWRSGLEGYVSNTLQEMNAPLIAFCQEKEIQLENTDIESLGASFEVFNRVRDRYKGSKHDFLLWADLRAITMIDLKNEQKFTETLWGPIAAATPRMRQLQLKPTSLIENEGIRGLRKHFFDIGFDPGPMAIGRGVKPTLFDALYGLDHLELAPEFSAFLQNASKDKIVQSLAIGMRVLLKNESRWPEFLMGWVRSQIVSEITEFTDSPNILFAGPLAPSLAKVIAGKSTEFTFNVDPDSSWLGSLVTLGLEGKSRGH